MSSHVSLTFFFKSACLCVYKEEAGELIQTSAGEFFWVPTVFRFPFKPVCAALWCSTVNMTHSEQRSEQKKIINKIPLFNLWFIWSVPQHLPTLLGSLTRVETCIACLLSIYKAWNKHFHICRKCLLFQTKRAWSRGPYDCCLLAHQWKTLDRFCSLTNCFMSLHISGVRACVRVCWHSQNARNCQPFLIFELLLRSVFGYCCCCRLGFANTMNAKQ